MLRLRTTAEVSLIPTPADVPVLLLLLLLLLLRVWACHASVLPLQNMLQLCNAVDFKDFLSLCVKLLEGHPSFLQLLAKHGMSAALPFCF
jgi:hypothetical protein